MIPSKKTTAVSLSTLIYILFFSFFVYSTFAPKSSSLYGQEAPSDNRMLLDDGAEEGMNEDPAKNYLEMAIDYINRNKYPLALKYLEAAKNSGDANIYEEALIWELYVRAASGETNLEDELDLFSDQNKAKAHYFVSDGWSVYFERNPEAAQIHESSIEIKEKLIAQYPDSRWGYIASMQLAPSLIESRQFDKALYYLLNYFNSAGKAGELELDYDKAWFYLGQILESSTEYRDLHKALEAYQRAASNPESQFYAQAMQRIKEIEQFYYITP